MIEGVGPDTPTATNEQGGMQSATPYRFDLIPPESMFACARVMAEGAQKYAPDNWRKIPVKDHLNHLIQHAEAYLAGDTQDDHLAHAICRAMMAYAVSQQETTPPDFCPKAVDGVHHWVATAGHLDDAHCASCGRPVR